MAEQKVNPENNPQDQGGQVAGNQGQQVGTQVTSGSQPPSDETLVELPDGQKVTFGELKKSRMLEADYRKKTAELAEERRRIEIEKQRREAEAQGPEVYGEGEELNPIQVLDARIARMEAFGARIYLDGEVAKLQSKYPNADPEAVKKICWGNPHAIIEDEMKRDHERIAGVQSSTQPLTPEKIAEFKQQGVNEYLAKKASGSSGSVSGVATGEGSQIVIDQPKPAESWKDCKEQLKRDLENESGLE